MKISFALAVTTTLLVACGKHAGETQAAPGEAAAANNVADTAIYAAAVANPRRSDTDRARDASRKPDAVLAFCGIQPGMRVLDLFSGGGYYSEILAHVVGDDGKVMAHSNQAYLGFVGDEFNARYADNRLPNVEILMAENNELQLDADSFDAVMMVLSFHDLYYAAPEQGWPKIDAARLLAELHKGLQAGGRLCVIDHYAESGAARETGGTLHRIDPGIVVREVQQAGLELEAKSDMLRNMHDDHAKSVFDASVRGRTDRFVLRFRKP